MAQQTKAERSASAKKAATTRKENELKESGTDLKRAASKAAGAAKDLGSAAVSTVKEAGRAASKRGRG
jgi:hypothetical protein